MIKESKQRERQRVQFLLLAAAVVLVVHSLQKRERKRVEECCVMKRG